MERSPEGERYVTRIKRSQKANRQAYHKENKMLLLIDNYDSFTYNLYQYLSQLGANVKVVRNDAITTDAIANLEPAGLVLSPGPGRPETAGITMDAIRAFAGKLPILGICLGHQSIAQVYGGKIVRAKNLMHGKVSQVNGDGEGLFANIANPFAAMRYHSLAVEQNSLPEELVITATADDGEIMGLRHKELPIEGIQFHPESIKTVVGKRILRNYIKMTDKWAK